ncbi:MAG: transcription antitermination protein NusB [Spirulinaceae cyanobacterium SM2_1_0]|nr:transcription antitermination protein NusB [Spirulinaceae cyanobacterium SM2_1_0]
MSPPPRQTPRRIARELALLSLSQLGDRRLADSSRPLQDLLLAAIRMLTAEVRDALETAATETQRSRERLVNSELRATDLQSARVTLNEAVTLTQTAINRLGEAVDLPEVVQLANQQDVREYACRLIETLDRHREAIANELTAALVDWQLNRLPQIDRDILSLAVAEMTHLEVPDRIAINEAIELAKRYADADSYRFINGVLRRVSNRRQPSSSPPATSPGTP